MGLVEAGRYTNSFDAGAARALLESHGLGAVLFDTEMSWEGLGGIIPIRLMVLDEDLEEAIGILSGSVD